MKVSRIICRTQNVDYFSMEGLHTSFFAMAIWVLFMMEMILRLLPSKLESHGCQKQFQSMYKPGNGSPVAGTARKGRKLTTLVWIMINFPFALLYWNGKLSQRPGFTEFNKKDLKALRYDTVISLNLHFPIPNFDIFYIRQLWTNRSRKFIG